MYWTLVKYAHVLLQNYATWIVVLMDIVLVVLANVLLVGRVNTVI